MLFVVNMGPVGDPYQNCDASLNRIMIPVINRYDCFRYSY